ncbi:MAG: carboxypeptidase-like regulatory domain-containing protein [Chitinophagaceae bacterium]
MLTAFWFKVLLISIVCLSGAGSALFCQVTQVTVRGSVYDMSKTRPLAGVSVMSTSGKGTATNDLGNYTMEVNENDSIYFSYLGKPTVKFAVKTMSNVSGFDISLHVQTNILPEFLVMPPSYKFDSAQNRLDYAKAFNYKKPGLGISTSPMGSGGAGVGLDLDQLINVFRFRKNKSMLSFQRRLVAEEEDKYIDHRFNKTIVKKITSLSGADLERFMKLCRPTYEFTQLSSEYEFYSYIKQSYSRYRTVFPASKLGSF